MRLKTVLAFGLLALLVGGAGAFAVLAQPKPGASGAHRVVIVGARGTLFDGEVDVAQATALSALQAAAARAGLAVDLVEYPGMGAYVRAIGNETARDASGWVFDVSDERGEWSMADRGAGATPLYAGQAVRWRWSDSA